MKTDLEEKLSAYLALREALGLPTSYLIPLLHEFVVYLASHCEEQTIRARYAVEWACLSNRSASTRRVRLVAARSFLAHLRAIMPGTEVPGVALIARPQRPEPFIFLPGQLADLLKLAGKLRSTKSIESITVQTIFGLMACTGLRPGEVMRLKLEHVLLDEIPPRLLVHRSKFCKTRWVPLHPSAVRKLRRYLHLRQSLKHADSSDHFFVTKKVRRILYLTLQRTFQEVVQQARIEPREGQLRPTLHSLRHTFAVRRLLHWYERGQDVQGLLPNLSVYLGHADPADTYWYLSSAPSLMVAAGVRFEKYASDARETRHEK